MIDTRLSTTSGLGNQFDLHEDVFALILKEGIKHGFNPSHLFHGLSLLREKEVLKGSVRLPLLPALYSMLCESEARYSVDTIK